MKKFRIWLLLIILLGWGLRLTQLGEQSLWYDEGVTWMLSQMQLPALFQWTAADIQPPLYYLLIWTTDIIFDDSEWMLRFPSAIFSVLTIPLIYALARRLFTPTSVPELYPELDEGLVEGPLPRTRAAVLAAGLFAISPLMIYYSQEARMYTLLTFQATLASYLLLKILHPIAPYSSKNRPSPRRWRDSPLPMGEGLGVRVKTFILDSISLVLSDPLLYALTAATALYTHYFAAFLLIAHAIYALVILWQRRFSKSLTLQVLIGFGGALLLFAPWLPTLFARLGDDPSYWSGALKLNEAIRKILISFTVGETVSEQTGWWLATIYIGLLILAGIYLLTVTRHSSLVTRHSSLFLLLWLLLPILLILILTYQSPKFNPRYTLLAWPAFALLTANILAQLTVVPEKNSLFRAKPPRGTIHYSLFTITFFASCIIFIITISTFSLFNRFTDPRFSKDDFRALAQFVREREARNETVLLSSGHLFPVWAYYYGWDGWTPLPWMLRLDVKQVTNLSIAAEMKEAIAGKEGVWLVTWQDEVIDPNGVAPFWLDLIGQRPDDAGDFWGVGLEHWRLDPDKISLLDENPIQRSIEFLTTQDDEEETISSHLNFANQVDLLGYTQLSDTELALFWRPQRPLPDDLTLTLALTDSDGFTWSRKTFVGRPGAYFYPPSRWPVGQIVMTRHHLSWQIGTPPGLYRLEVGLGTPNASAEVNTANVANAAGGYEGWDILDAQGNPQRRTALLDFVNLSQLERPESGPLPMEQNPEIDMFPIIAGRRIILPEASAQPGDRLLLALLWQAGEYNLDDVSIAFDLTDVEGQTHRVGSSFTPSREFNLPRWQSGDVVLGQYWLDIPPEAAPGQASLEIHIINVSGFFYDELFPLAEIEILPTERNFTPPAAVDIPLEADFSGQATLIGVDCPNDCRATPDESITLKLYWRADARFETNYTIFTHLLDANETVLVNADHAPPKPTQGWVVDEIITNEVTLNIPAELPAGEYAVEIGMYDANDPSFQRLPLSSGDTRVVLPQPLTIN